MRANNELRYGGSFAANDNTKLKLDFLHKDEAKKEVEEFRKTLAGQLCINMYKEYRSPTARLPSVKVKNKINISSFVGK